MTKRAVGVALTVSLLFPAFAEARRVSLWIEPLNEVSNNAGSRLAEHVRVTLPDHGRVKERVWPGAVWVDGKCRVEVGATARERRGGDTRFTIRDRYARWPYVSVAVDVNRHCAKGTRARILRSAKLDARRASCARDGKTVARNRFLRVYDQPPFRKVCALASHRRFDLGYSRDNTRCYVESCYVGETRIEGRLMAYADEYAGRRDSSSTLYVRDGLTGRELLRVQSGATCDPTNRAGPVYSLVLRADAAVAWIVAGCVWNPAPTYEVRTPAGVLAAGTDIDPGSLALTADGGVAWMQGGTARTAPLARAVTPSATAQKRG